MPRPNLAQPWSRLVLLAGLALGLGTWSCGDSSSSGGGHNTGAGSPTGGSGGAVPTGGGGSGGTIPTGGGGSGGDSGGSGGGSAQNGVQASDLVNAGNQAASDNFKLTHSLGQPSQNQGTMTSPSYRMQGGLIGAMGTLP